MNHTGRNFTRNKVRERDDFTCKECGFKRTPEDVIKHNKKIIGLKGRIKSLDVHHINGLCGTNSKGYDKVQDMENMITLCHRDHYNRHDHRKYGSNKGFRDAKKLLTVSK